MPKSSKKISRRKSLTIVSIHGPGIDVDAEVDDPRAVDHLAQAFAKSNVGRALIKAVDRDEHPRPVDAIIECVAGLDNKELERVETVIQATQRGRRPPVHAAI